MQVFIAKSVRDRRKALGMSQRELAEAVGFGSHQIVSELERGQRDVKAWELARIADVLHTSLSAFFQRERAGKPEPQISWRTDAPEADRCRHEAKLLKRFERYRRIQELTNASGDARSLPRFHVDRSTTFGQTEQMASRARRSMDLGGRPAMSLADILQERFGVMLFLDDLGSRGSAACARTDSDAAILLNRNEAPWRRCYSLAHELFHLVTWDSAMASWPRGNQHTTWPDRVEELANGFASALLLRGDDLRGEFQSRFEGRYPSDPELVNMARAYGVSTSVLLWRLRTLGLMEEEAVRERLGNGSFRGMDRASVPRHGSEPPPDLPDRFVRLVALAYRTGDISRSVAARYLETNPGELYYLDWDEDDGWGDGTTNCK